jgi:hypothetical protein
MNSIENDTYNVIVYCGGKCGSSTLVNTFKNNNYKSLHTHNFNYYKSIMQKDIYNIIDNQKEIIYIIDSYRLPIERKISSFFQNINLYIPDYNNKSITELIDIFNNDFLMVLEEYHSINEILDHYKLSHFDKFNFEKKYVLQKKDNLIFIKIRFHDINNWENILSEIFNRSIILYPDNLTSNKSIHNLYKEFKEIYKVPKKYIENCLINNIENNESYIEFKIYNTSEEQIEYINYWLEKSY